MTALDYTLADVIAHMRELAQNGAAPSVRTWNQERRPGMPGYETLALHGYTWLELCEAAGLEPAKRGGKPGNTNATGAQRIERFADADAEVRQMFATAEPPRPNTWPIFGIPTRSTTFTWQRADGATVRTTHEYYSLR